MKVRSICILSTFGLLGLVLAAQASHAQGMAPGQAAPPLPTLDLTKPGSPRPSAVTQRSPATAALPAPAAPPAKPVVTKAPTPADKAQPRTTTAKAKPTKAKPAKGKPGAVAGVAPRKKVTTKAPTKSTKGKPASRPTTQTATAGDR